MDKSQSTKTVQGSVARDHPKSKSVKSKPTKNPSRDHQAKIDQEILDAYIGHNHQKITDRPYNLAALFLQGFYLLYRRMFLAGVILILAEFAVYGFVSMFSSYHIASWVYTILYVVVGIILCFTFNKFYIAYARHKINILRRRNPTFDNTDIHKLCSEHRHTSGLTVVGGIVLVFVIMIFVNIICQAVKIPSPFDGSAKIDISQTTAGSNNSDQSNTVTNSANDYTGSVDYNTSINIADEFSLQIPDEFIDNSSAYRFQFDYSLDQTDANQCEFTLGVIQKFTDAQRLANQMANFNTNTPPTVQTSVIDNQQWYWFTNDDSLFGIKYTYITNKNDKIYLMTYQEPNNDQAPQCAEFRQIIISSLKST